MNDTENIYVYPANYSIDTIKSDKYQDFEKIVRIYNVDNKIIVATYDE